MNEHGELRDRIDEAKRRLPMPNLLSRLGLGEHAKTSAHCPFPGHEDKHKSFSVFKGQDGFWHWNCFSGCGDGDEIMFLRKLKGLSLTSAMNLFLDMVGFPPRRAESREYPSSRMSRTSRAFPECPECPECPESHVYPVSPVSEGQCLDKELAKELKALAVCNACTRAEDRADKKRFKLARDLRSLQKKLGRKLTTTEVRVASDEWERISLPCLDWNGADHFAMLLAEVKKVRVPTGEGDTVNKALENVSRLSDAGLPEIPGYPDARKPMRKLAALHREMSHLRDGKVYFLSYRDAAKACPELNPSSAHTTTLALDQFGVVKIVSKGKAGPNSKKAAEFRYVLSETESRFE